MGVKTVIFYCNWSTYPGLQMSRMGLEKADLDRKLVVSMCSGRVSPELITKPLVEYSCLRRCFNSLVMIRIG